MHMLQTYFILRSFSNDFPKQYKRNNGIECREKSHDTSCE